MRAQAYVDRLIFKASKCAKERHTNQIMRAACAVAETMYRQGAAAEAAGDSGIKSETTGAVRVEYVTADNSAEGQAARERELYKAAEMYLLPCGLLFAGVFAC